MRVSANNWVVLNRPLLAIIAIGLLAGCETSPPSEQNPHAAAPVANPPPGGAPQSPAAPAAAAANERPISDAEAQAFAKSLDAAFKSGDLKAIDAKFDYDAMLRRSLSQLDIPEWSRQLLTYSATQSWSGPDGFGAQIALDARLHFLRVHRHGGEQRVFFRRTQNDAVNYFDFVMVCGADGIVRIADFYNYIMGDLNSVTLRREAVGWLTRQAPETVRGLSPADQAYSRSFDEIDGMRQLRTAGRYSEALDVFKRLPDSVKNHSRVVHDYVLSCSGVGKECDESIRAYRAARPDDSGFDLVLFDYYAVRRQFDPYLVCIDRLDKAVGGDPYLDIYRANAYLKRGDLAQAKKYAEKAAAAAPHEPVARASLEAIKRIALVKQPAVRVNLADASPGAPAADEEARAFAEEFAKNVMHDDAPAIRAAVDAAAVYHRAIVGIHISEARRIGVESMFDIYMAGVISDFFAFSGPLIERGGSFRLLRLHRNGSEQRAMFRMLFPEGAVTYYDCILVRHADGKVRIDDVYSFTYGMLLSENLHRRWDLTYGNGMENESIEKIEASDGARLTSAQTEMNGLIAKKQYQAALDIYDALPDRLQREKVILRTRITAARPLKGNPYDDAIHDYRKEFPNEPNLDLIMIDSYAEHKRFDLELGCIERLDRSVGGDPYLDEFRASAYRMKGDLSAAKEYAGKAIVAEPDARLPYFTLLLISLAEKDFAETNRLLTIYQKKFPKHIPDLKSEPAYADYIKSAAYRTWAEAQKP
jgi:tetratricopeptide (TPR) repeat protein